MKIPRRFVLLAGAFAFAFAAPAVQAQPDRAPTEVQKSYDRFITAFRAALKADDSAAVAELTMFPFYWGEMRDADYFRKNIYAKAFPRKARACIARGRGLYGRDGLGKDNFTIVCGEDLFVFTGTPAGFRFSEVGMND